MKPWSIEDTCKHVESYFGRAHLDSVAPSFNSLSQRLSFARYHYQETQRLFCTFVELQLATKPLLVVSHGTDQVSREAFELLMLEVGAHATACVLSIHAIPDIIAYAIYHALGYNLGDNPLREHAISAARIQNLLCHVPTHSAISEILSKLCSDASYKHLGALANKSKHQSIVKPMLNEDFTGSRAQRYEFRFSAFQYNSKNFPEATFASVLEPSYELASRTVVETGNTLNEILSKNVVQ